MIAKYNIPTTRVEA